MSAPRANRLQRWRLRLRRDQPADPVTPDEVTLGDRSLDACCEAVLGQRPGATWRLGGANNRQSLCVTAGDRQYKVFECSSAAQASAVASALAKLHAAGVPAPALHGVVAHVVVTEWVAGIPGKALSRRDLAERMPVALARLHGVRPRLEATAMPHGQWLLDRLERLAAPRMGTDRVAAVIDQLRARAPAESPLAVIHPDFIPANLVLAEADALVAVDNEFLAVGRGMELDVLNAADALYRRCPRAHERFLERWLALVTDSTLVSHRAWWEALFEVQRIGGAFARGKTGQGAARFARLEQALKHLP